MSDEQRAEPVVLRAGSKANLYLEILGRRSDGLHEIESLFIPLQQPSDALHIEPAEAGSGFALSCSHPELAGGENILCSTYARYGRQTGCWPDLHLHLVKGIPYGSGLGGASSDAAAFLMYLHEQTEPCKRLPFAQLLELAASLGSDVPFFLGNIPAWVTGAGESVDAVALDLRGWQILVVCPDTRVSTAWAYRVWDAFHPELSQQGSRSLTNDAFRYKEAFCSQGQVWRNGFEMPIFHELPALGSFKEALLLGGARAAVLSGSGASMVALFKDSLDMQACAKRFSSQGVACFMNSL